MIEPQTRCEPEWPEDEVLRDALFRGDRMLESAGSILAHLLSARDHSLFSDEILARIRGMVNHIASQILRIQAEATGHRAREHFAAEHCLSLSERLLGNRPLVSHCHALALEWQVSTRLEAQLSLDPVLSPMMQRLVGHEDPMIASAAMAALAAQARFARTQRRMELPLGELPGDRFHDALLEWRSFNGEERSDALVRAETKLRDQYDEAGGRLSLIARVVSSLGSEAQSLLAIESAGASLFLTALAARSGQPRELAAFSTHEQQMARLALGLRAAGLKPEEIETQVLRIHPDVFPPREIEQIGTREAARMLEASALDCRD
ncbi:MAG: hypothetical protein ACR2FJ_08480 [Qipengyuania sp.]